MPTQAAERLVALYERSEPGDADWYAIAHRQAAERARALSVPVRRYLGVVAATSPNQQWGPTKAGAYPNLNAADNVIAWHRGTRDKPGTMLQSATKAAAILDGADPDFILGPKTRNFYHALRADRAAVTLDRWALRAIGWPRDTITEAELPAAAAAYHEAAELLGVDPAALQAATWAVVRRES